MLIDGRARASCAEYILKYLHPDSLVFIHDYQDRYFYHGIVEQHYQKVITLTKTQHLAKTPNLFYNSKNQPKWQMQSCSVVQPRM